MDRSPHGFGLGLVLCASDEGRGSYSAAVLGDSSIETVLVIQNRRRAAGAIRPFLRECTRSLSTHAHTLQMVSRLRAPLEGLISSAQQAESGDDAQRSRRLALHEASLLVPAYSKEVLDV